MAYRPNLTTCKKLARDLTKLLFSTSVQTVYGVPRGGIPVAFLLTAFAHYRLVDNPEEADIIVDDIVDSGATYAKWKQRFPKAKFAALFGRPELPPECYPDLFIADFRRDWIEFPWEIAEEGHATSAFDAVTRMLQYIGEDPTRQGLVDTPKRAVKAWDEWFKGYGEDPSSFLKTFEDGAENVDEMVLVRNVPVWSHCVVGNTLISTPRGKIPIKELKDGDWVYCVDEESLNLHLMQCRNPRITQNNAKLVRVYTGGNIVECTPKHKFLTHNRGWVEAANLKIGDSLVTWYHTANAQGRPLITGYSGEPLNKILEQLTVEMKGSKNHRVIRVEPLNYTEDVYCMDVPEFKNFFANDICVHNCEHHIAPFFGVAHVAYIPDGKIVGLSKIPKVVDSFSRRLQVQERLTNQVADCLENGLSPLGVAVVIEAKHLCMCSRGVKTFGSDTITSAMRGVFKSKPEARAEFLSLIK